MAFTAGSGPEVVKVVPVTGAAISGVTMEQFLCVCAFFTLPIGPQPYAVIYVVANPVRGLLGRNERA